MRGGSRWTSTSHVPVEESVRHGSRGLYLFVVVDRVGSRTIERPDLLRVHRQSRTAGFRAGISSHPFRRSGTNQTSVGVYHGHVRTWDELTDQQRNALIEVAGQTRRSAGVGDNEPGRPGAGVGPCSGPARHRHGGSGSGRREPRGPVAVPRLFAADDRGARTVPEARRTRRRAWATPPRAGCTRRGRQGTIAAMTCVAAAGTLRVPSPTATGDLRAAGHSQRRCCPV